MRTTLDVADDVLMAAKEMARLENSTSDEVPSCMARREMTASRNASQGRWLVGFRMISQHDHVVSNEHVNSILEIGGIRCALCWL